MTTRRNFLRTSLLGMVGLSSRGILGCAEPSALETGSEIIGQPTVVSTWRHGQAANADAWVSLKKGGTSLDAVEAGVRNSESDPENQSVGLGGLPDREGRVTLDACIMNAEGDCGAVAFLQNIENPISVARKVMEDTPHVMLVGEGAYLFAREKGFPDRDLLLPKAKKQWEEWKKKSQYKPIINRENHDTIGLLALDGQGNLSGACTTSGMAYKLHGRVGDSPIIGAGLFVDNEIGAACATGVGEAVIRVCGSHLVVELMRQGYSPEEACKAAVERIMKKEKSLEGLQVGFLALNKAGQHGAYSVYQGFDYAIKTEAQDEMVDAKYFKTW